MRPAPRISLTIDCRAAIDSQPALEVSADPGDVAHQIAVDQLLEKHQRGAARQKVAAIRAPVIAERRRFCDALAEQRRRNRDAGAERLAHGHQVWLETQRLRVERPPGAAEAALDFVGDQQRTCLAARLLDRIGHLLAERPNAALALEWFEDDGAGRLSDRRQQRFRILRRHELHVRQQRCERRAIVVVPRHRQRPHRPAVKRLLEGDDARPLRVLLRVPVAARELQARFDRLRAAVAEEGARQPREVRQPRREFPLQRVEVQVRRVNQRRRLLGDGGGQARIGVAERAHADAGDQIEIAATLRRRRDGTRDRARTRPDCVCKPGGRARTRARPHCWQPSSCFDLHHVLSLACHAGARRAGLASPKPAGRRRVPAAARVIRSAASRHDRDIGHTARERETARRKFCHHPRMRDTGRHHRVDHVHRAVPQWSGRQHRARLPCRRR